MAADPRLEGYYEVSNRGRVWSVPRTFIRRNGVPYRLRGRIMRTYGVRPGSDLFKITLAADGQRHGRLVQLLVAEAFRA